MSAARRTIGQTEHDVDMKAGLSVIADRDVADRTENLALFVDFDFPVALRGEIEPAHRRPFEGPDRGQGGGGNARLPGKTGKRRKRLFSASGRG